MPLKNILLTLFLIIGGISCTESPVIIKSKPAKIAIKKPVPAALTKLPKEVALLLRNQGVSQKGMSAYIQALNSPKPLLTFNADILIIMYLGEE